MSSACATLAMARAQLGCNFRESARRSLLPSGSSAWEPPMTPKAPGCLDDIDVVADEKGNFSSVCQTAVLVTAALAILLRIREFSCCLDRLSSMRMRLGSTYLRSASSDQARDHRVTRSSASLLSNLRAVLVCVLCAAVRDAQAQCAAGFAQRCHSSC